MLLHVCECICTCVYLHVERDAGLIWESSQVVLLSFSPRQALSNPELVNMLVLLGSSLQGPPPPRSCLLRLGLQMGHHTYRIYMSFWGYKPQSSNFHSKGSNHWEVSPVSPSFLNIFIDKWVTWHNSLSFQVHNTLNILSWTLIRKTHFAVFSLHPPTHTFLSCHFFSSKLSHLLIPSHSDTLSV